MVPLQRREPDGPLRLIRDEIRKLDRQHPVHVNPHNLAAEFQTFGQSIWREREIVDFIGCSAHPAWHSTRFPEGRIGQSVAYFADLMRSSTPDPERRFWVTELQGGTVIADGLIAFKNIYGNLNRDGLQAAAKLFGAQVEDIIAGAEPGSLRLADDAKAGNPEERLPGWLCRLPLRPDEACAAGWFDDGAVGLTERKLGKGAAIRIGTVLFQHYFAKPDPLLLEWLRRTIAPLLQDEPVRLISSCSTLRLRRLEHPQGVIAVILNSGEAAEARLQFARAGACTNLDTGEEFPVQSMVPVAIPVPAGETVQLFLRW